MSMPVKHNNAHLNATISNEAVLNCPEEPASSRNAVVAGVDRLARFANTVETAEEATTSRESAHLKHEVLSALLEDPVHVLCGKPFLGHQYEEVPILWEKSRETSKTRCSAMESAVHEVSQTFVRPLSFGRRRCFRIHRFRLSTPSSHSLMSDLSALALKRAEQQTSEAMGENGLRGSNIGGFQDVVNAREPLCSHLRDIFTDAIQLTNACDVEQLVTTEQDATPPSSPRNDGTFAAWMNVSKRGALNHLHNHGTSAWAAVAYTRVPENECAQHADSQLGQGALLLRLSRGTGSRFMEPDEDLHVPRMWLAAADEAPGDIRKAVETESSEAATVRYLQLKPTEGSVVVFPGWLSHSVSPHFLDEDRVCFASNWS